MQFLRKPDAAKFAECLEGSILRGAVEGVVCIGAGCGCRYRETWGRDGGWEVDTVCDSVCDCNCPDIGIGCIGGEGLDVNLRAIP